jgi:hypothetical protein
MMTRWYSGLPYVQPISEEFIFTVKTDNAGTSGTNQFTLPTTGSDFDCIVNWGDGTSDAYVGTMGSPTHTYPSVGTYEIKISGVFPRIFFNNAGDRLKIIEIKNLGVYAGGSVIQFNAFNGCTNLIIDSPTLGFFGNVTSFQNAWVNCSSLTSFPLLNVSSGTNFQSAWFGCSSLTSFPLLDVSSGTNFQTAWFLCSSLTSFPLLNVSSGTNFQQAWQACSSLTSFPLLNVSSGTNFFSAWRNCTSLTSFPPNMFDTVTATNFGNAFTSTALNQTSIDNILVSINTANTSGGTFNQSGGSAPSVATGRPAIDALRSRGWTVTVTGGY